MHTGVWKEMDAISSAYWNNKSCNPLPTTHLKKKARRGLEVICINIHKGGKPWHISYLIPCNCSAVYRTHFWKFILELPWMHIGTWKRNYGPLFLHPHLSHGQLQRLVASSNRKGTNEAAFQNPINFCRLVKKYTDSFTCIIEPLFQKWL